MNFKRVASCDDDAYLLSKFLACFLEVQHGREMIFATMCSLSNMNTYGIQYAHPLGMKGIRASL